MNKLLIIIIFIVIIVGIFLLFYVPEGNFHHSFSTVPDIQLAGRGVSR